MAKTLQQMTQPPGTRLTPELARELCQRAGSKAYLAGAIGRLGSEYVVGLKVGELAAMETRSRRNRLQRHPRKKSWIV